MPFALVASLSGHAAGPPLITDDPGTPGDGRWEINLPITLEQTRDERIFEAPLLDINYGLGERTQLKFEVPWLVVDRRDNGTTDGLGNSEIGIKHRFLDEDRHGVSMSIYPQLEFNNPTSSDERGLVDEGMRFKLPVQMTRSAGPFEWYLEAGYEFVEASEDQWLYGVATTIASMANWNCWPKLPASPARISMTKRWSSISARRSASMTISTCCCPPDAASADRPVVSRSCWLTAGCSSFRDGDST
jgi:hypothetical protein